MSMKDKDVLFFVIIIVLTVICYLFSSSSQVKCKKSIVYEFEYDCSIWIN